MTAHDTPEAAAADREPGDGTPGDGDQLADLGYAAAAAELDAILERLDDDRVDVDDLARQVRRAAELIRYCRARITDARTEVERVVAELDDLAGDGDGD